MEKPEITKNSGTPVALSHLVKWQKNVNADPPIDS